MNCLVKIIHFPKIAYVEFLALENLIEHMEFYELKAGFLRGFLLYKKQLWLMGQWANLIFSSSTLHIAQSLYSKSDEYWRTRVHFCSYPRPYIHTALRMYIMLQKQDFIPNVDGYILCNKCIGMRGARKDTNALCYKFYFGQTISSEESSKYDSGNSI